MSISYSMTLPSPETRSVSFIPLTFGKLSFKEELNVFRFIGALFNLSGEKRYTESIDEAIIKSFSRAATEAPNEVVSLTGLNCASA